MKADVLGRREDQRLELKSRAALEEPGGIARAVVGMLNAEGGEIWIGVEDEDDVAVKVDPVPDPERAKSQLLDHLVDVIDPSPTPQELALEVVPRAADPGVLVVKVQPSGEESGRRPYAFKKRGGWHFLRRVGARNHPMSREEIQEVFGPATAVRYDGGRDEAVLALEEAKRELRDTGETGLWVGIQPVRKLHLDPEDPLYDRIILDHTATGNRAAGWNFARASSKPEPAKDGSHWGHWSQILGKYLSRVRVKETGLLCGTVTLERLHRKGEEREIWPLILLEYPISAFRIARVIYGGHLEPDDPVAADLALFGLGGWKLREGTPGDFFLGNDLSQVDEPDLLWEPVVFPFREIDETPDRCGFRLVRRVYHAFGWRESDMPRQYDRDTGRLILPE